MRKVIGIDFGSSNTVIYVTRKGVVYNEPTVVAYNRQNKKVISTGYLAFKLLGKAPENVSVSQPVSKGVVSNGPTAVMFLDAVLKELKLRNMIKKSKVIVSFPSELTQIEEAGLNSVLKKLGCKDFEFKSQAYLAAIGGNRDGAAVKGSIVVNIGGGISDIAVLSNNEVIISSTSEVSGSLIDNNLIRYLRKKHHLIIGKKTAEYIKMKIGSVESYPENRLLEVSGIDIVSSLPHSVVISTQEIKECIVNTIQPLVDDIVDILEVTPPEIAADIIQSGVLISGGGALLTGIRDYLENSLNMAVRLASDPSNAVTEGLKIVSHQYLQD